MRLTLPKEMSVERLPVHARAQTNLYHWSGRQLVAAGQYLTPSLLTSLLEVGIETVYTSPEEHVSPEHLDAMDVFAIAEDTPVPFAIYDRDGNLLAQEGSCLRTEQINALHQRGSKVYYFNKDRAAQAAAFQAKHTKKIRDSLDEHVIYGRSLKPEKSGIPLERTARAQPGRARPRVVLAATEDFHHRAVAGLHLMWKTLLSGGFIRHTALFDLVNSVLDRFLRERQVMAALAPLTEEGSDAPAHCLGTSVYALLMAFRLGYNRAQARDLLMASLFHDVGYILVPPELRRARRNLTRRERERIFRHIEHGLYLTSRLDWPGDDYKVAIYQHHERGTGTGYPAGYRADQMHEYARILAAADVFHALLSDRPHRKGYLPSEALNRTIKMATIGLLDRAAVKALVDELSLYPVGATVVLSTGELARVTAASREPARPYVGVIVGADGKRLAAPRIIDLSRFPGIAVRADVASFPEPLAGF